MWHTVELVIQVFTKPLSVAVDHTSSTAKKSCVG